MLPSLSASTEQRPTMFMQPANASDHPNLRIEQPCQSIGPLRTSIEWPPIGIETSETRLTALIETLGACPEVTPAGVESNKGAKFDSWGNAFDSRVPAMNTSYCVQWTNAISHP